MRNGHLVAVGSLTGELRNAADEVIGSVTNQRVRFPISFGAITSCDVLRLRLGPVDLDLLGLVVHLDRVVLDITAEAGPGNLLGNLLCAIAGILDRGLNLNGVLRDLLAAVLGVHRALSNNPPALQGRRPSAGEPCHIQAYTVFVAIHESAAKGSRREPMRTSAGGPAIRRRRSRTSFASCGSGRERACSTSRPARGS